MEKIIILQDRVIQYLNHLINILFEKEYFAFEDSAQEYVSKIYDFIEFNLPNMPYKITPPYLYHLGSNYTFYKASNRTTWYFFFEKQGNRYLITHITNNHMSEANWL